jgi:phosphoglycolate phosphatase
MKYKLAIFDWNGTLIDDSFANHAGSNATFLAAGRPPISIEQYRDTMDFPLIHFYNRNGVDTDTYLSKTSVFNNAFMDVYKREQEAANLRRGAMDVLDSLLDSGMILMILSNHVQEHLEEQLARLHVHAKFKHICGNPVFRSEELTTMTKLDRLKKVMAENSYNPSEAFIIGDSLEEPDIAHTLGMKSISVTWGCFSEGRLRKSQTHHVIHEMSDLLPILEIEPPTKKLA